MHDLSEQEPNPPVRWIRLKKTPRTPDHTQKFEGHSMTAVGDSGLFIYYTHFQLIKIALYINADDKQ